MIKVKKNIVICVEKNTSKRDILRFGVNYLKKFYNVDIINFTYIINKKKTEITKYEENIKNLSEFEKKINNKNYICAIDYLRTSEPSKVYKIKRLIKKYNIKLVQVHNGLLPIEPNFSKEKLFKVLNLHLVFMYIINKLKKFFFINQTYFYDISLISGLAAEKIYPETQYSKKKIYTHSFDYENTLNSKKIFKNKKLAVFIDENLICHPDYKIFGLNLRCYKKEYYQLLIRTLKSYQQKFDLKIIICAHPSMTKEECRLYFKGVNYVIGKTEEYTKKSTIVFIHQSTAISYSIIYQKPLIFLNYKKLNKTYLYNNINRLAKLFNKKPYHIDFKNSFNKKLDFKIDKKKYLEYLKNYICHPKSDKKKSMWFSLAEELKK